MNDIERALRENLVVSLWPVAGKALGLKRGATYGAAERGDIPTTDVGHLKKSPQAGSAEKSGSTRSPPNRRSYRHDPGPRNDSACVMARGAARCVRRANEFQKTSGCTAGA